MASALVYGTPMFWLLPWALTAEVTLFVILIFLVQLEKFGWSTTMMIASVVIYAILGHFFKWPKVSDLFSRENFWIVLRYFGYYLFGALVWSFTKWLFFLYDFRDKRDEAVERFKANRSIGVQGELTLDDIHRNLGHERYKRTYLSGTVKFRDYKAMVTSWAIWWPASLIGTLLDDLVRKLVHRIIDLFGGLYQKAADRIVPEIKL